MKILPNSIITYQSARRLEQANNPVAYDHDEEKLVIRFEPGVDFDGLDGFVECFLSLIVEGKQPWAKRQSDRMRQIYADVDIGTLGGIDIGIPVECLILDRVKELVE